MHRCQTTMTTRATWPQASPFDDVYAHPLFLDQLEAMITDSQPLKGDRARLG